MLLLDFSEGREIILALNYNIKLYCSLWHILNFDPQGIGDNRPQDLHWYDD